MVKKNRKKAILASLYVENGYTVRERVM